MQKCEGLLFLENVYIYIQICSSLYCIKKKKTSHYDLNNRTKSQNFY